ncbi:MFS transporter [Burkholderiaceae bacterium DAT-1]|nr:MFS transporter [Burkholderiaceae bacterium DAT-1]
MSDASLFRNRLFSRFWLSRMCSVSANQMLGVAIGWQMYDLTHSVIDLGYVGLLQFLPRLLLVLHAGEWVDRHDRRRLMALSQCVQAAGAGLLVFAMLNHWISRELIFIASLAVGAGRTVEMPASQAVLPHLVDQAILPRAVAANAASSQAAIIAGPAIGGFLYAFSETGVFGLTTILMTLAIIFSLSLPTVPNGQVTQGSRLDSLLAGIRFIQSHPFLLGAISLDLFAVLLGGATALLPVFAHDILHVGPWGLGLLRAAPAMGALLMSFYLTAHPPSQQVGLKMFVAVAIFGLMTILFGLSESFWLSLAVLIVMGAADMVSVVIRSALMQLHTPDEMRGRVGSVNSLFIGASNQLGEFESGVTAAWFGTVGSVAVGGVGTLLVVALWMRGFPALRKADKLGP